MNAWLRPLLLLVNTVVVLLAVVTLGGRVLMHFLDDLEPAVNRFSARWGVELRDIEGGWRGLNPIVRARSVRFPGGRAEGVAFELDLIETVVRSTVIAHRLSVAALEVMPIRTLDGRWTLGTRAPAGEGGFDPRPFIEHSDQLDLADLRVRVAREAPGNLEDPLETLGEFALRVRVVNDLSRHRGHVALARVGDACTACEVDLRWDLSQVLVGIDLEGEIALRGDGFRLPAAVGRALGLGGATFETLQGGWSVRNGDGTGRMTLHLRDIALVTGALDAVDVELHGASYLWHRDILADVSLLEVRAGDAATSITGLKLALRTGLTDTALEFAVPSVDIARQIPVVHAALGEIRGAREWLPALDPRGTLSSVSGRFSISKRRLALAGTLEDVALEHYKGSPLVRDGRARVIGSERGFLLRLEGDPVTIGLLDIYAQPTRFDALAGDVHLWFKDKFLMVRGDALDARFGAAHARGGFSVSRPQEAPAQRVGLWIRAEDLDALAAKRFVPMKLSANLRRWIDTAVVAGSAEQADVAFHGYIRSIDNLPVRQAEIRFDVDGGAVRFHPEWPLAAALDGTVVIGAAGVHADLRRGTLRGIELAAGRIEAPKPGSSVHFVGRGSALGETLRDLIDDSPLAVQLSFLRPEWTFSGPLDYRIDLTVPIRSDGPPLSVALDADLEGFRADLADISLVLEDLEGPVQYRYPDDVRSPGVTGRMFGEPARFDAERLDDRVRLGFEGRASVPALSRWLGLAAGDRLRGALDFDGRLDLWPGQDRDVEIDVSSDLTGVVVDLPEPFAKAAAAPQPLAVHIEPRDDAVWVSATAADLGNGWLRLPSEGRASGVVVLGGDAPPEDPAREALTLTGSIVRTDLGAWLGLAGAGLRQVDPQAGVDVGTTSFALSDLRIAKLTARELAFDELVVDAFAREGTAGLAVKSAAIEGSLEVPAEGPIRVDVQHLRLPPGNEEIARDPLEGFDMSFVDAVDVKVAETRVGDAPYGAWQFGLRREGDVVRLENLVGDLRGLHLEGTEPLTWQWRRDPQTRFRGRITGTNLAEVLSAFGYAPSIETKELAATVDLGWPGSPLNFALRPLAGTLDVRARDGRFIDVDSGSGPMRVFSLLNFTAIAKRMALDFSDVFGKGVSFDVLTAQIALDQQRVDFLEPMVIDGTGAYFRVSGHVDLATGELSNEMIVTLPVSKSLPWYAAYLSFVNPLAAGAVLVGERIFRNQIQQVSTATYRVRGTLGEPEVTFVGIFGRPPQSDDAQASVNAPAQSPAAPAQSPAAPAGSPAEPEEGAPAGEAGDKQAQSPPEPQ